VVAIWPNPVTVVLAVLLLGGRQLGFGVLVHECGHRSLFRSPLLNDLVADWLLAPPTFNDRVAYMRGHVGHHRLAGTAEDPDLPNYQDYPISRARLRRKLARDLTGKTGFRTLAGIVSAWRRYPTLAPERQAALRRGLGMQIVLLAGMTLAGAPWLYLVWIGAFVFTNPLVSRLRQIAEHAAVPDRLDPDPRRNTRTVMGGAIARLLVCPHRINYHLEHHLLPSVPIYRLRAMHALLHELFGDLAQPTDQSQLCALLVALLPLHLAQLRSPMPAGGVPAPPLPLVNVNTGGVEATAFLQPHSLLG
jgi:fatty acid desaturase